MASGKKEKNGKKGGGGIDWLIDCEWGFVAANRVIDDWKKHIIINKLPQNLAGIKQH